MQDLVGKPAQALLHVLRVVKQLAEVGFAFAQRLLGAFALADLPLNTFLSEAVIPYEMDEVTRLIIDTHDAAAFRPLAHLTVGAFREWLLSHEVTADTLAGVAPGVTVPEFRLLNRKA